MTEEEIDMWFKGNGGRQANITRYESHWAVFVSDRDAMDLGPCPRMPLLGLEGDGEGGTLLEALTEAIADYQLYACGAV